MSKFQYPCPFNIWCMLYIQIICKYFNYGNHWSGMVMSQVPDDILEEAKAAAKAALEEMDAD